MNEISVVRSDRHPAGGHGIAFSEAVKDGDSFEVDGYAIPVIGRAALIQNKRAAGRSQDIADVKALGG